PREGGAHYDDAVVVQAALAAAARAHFHNTGPTGQRAISMVEAELRAAVSAGLPSDVVARSEAQGAAVAEHVLAWSADDGGAVVENMGFPYTHALGGGPEHWAPTSLIAQQQMPLLPRWGENRPFAMPSGASCEIPDPPAYSEEPGSPFHAEAREVHAVWRSLTVEQRAIARFWSDDPMLSPTPPGHWIAIALRILEDRDLDLDRSVDALARLGVGLADAFIGCWRTKFRVNLVRPVTYIRRVIDPAFEPIMTTPPFPEYPSGHSTQSGAAATVLTDVFGDGYAFEDTTHVDDGIPARSFPSFWAAAQEAGVSRLYGGIHFRAAIEQGLDQGRCIGAHTNALVTWR
ncbi:MAG TPA: vanadium-dependent haloperoxidase, partial [Methylomirabilota bacterium]|nr:vanadium-dependent haloperoxidase [Methylomirabilota bacterium]